jgi:hypothetical protein
MAFSDLQGAIDMQTEQLQQRINRIEECADQAKQCVQQGSVPDELRQCIDTLHQQARQAKQQSQQSSGGQQSQGQQLQGQSGQQSQQGQQSQESLKQAVMQMEQTGDRAMQACRSAGDKVDQQTQQAVKRAHDEISSLKKEIQMQ